MKKTWICVQKLKGLLRPDEKCTVFKTKHIEKMHEFKIAIRLRILGMYRPHSLEGSNSLKYKYPAILLYLGLITLLMGIPICSLRTVKEYVIACQGWSATFIMFCAAVDSIYRVPKIYDLMDNFTETIRKREFQKQYWFFSEIFIHSWINFGWLIKGLEDPRFKSANAKMNHKIKKYQTILNVYFAVFVPGPVILMYISVLINYSMRSLEPEDYLLPYPIW